MRPAGSCATLDRSLSTDESLTVWRRVCASANPTVGLGVDRPIILPRCAVSRDVPTLLIEDPSMLPKPPGQPGLDELLIQAAAVRQENFLEPPALAIERVILSTTTSRIADLKELCTKCKFG